MNRFFVVMGILLLAGVTGNQGYALSGGPDAYGYTWKDSDEPGGPVYNWVDITGIGTQITGLADDNSAPTFTDIGFNFHYYWSDYNKIKIGSNGWLSFENASNIASCFPLLPTGGGVNNILAPFMSDLTFIGVGNTATVHYWTNSTIFIVQYTNVPYWQATAPGYTGSNSFQVILNSADSSITFQYQTLTAFTNNGACNADLEIGIENLTGNIGLECYNEVTPPNNYAIKFYYPSVVTFQVQDATPNWNQNTTSRGVFVGAGTFPIMANIKNVGNTNITSNINVSAQIRDQAFVLVHADGDTLTSLNAGSSTTINFNPANILVPGQYSYQVSTNCLADINPSNNQRLSEIEVVNICSAAMLTYHTNGVPDQQVGWNAGVGNDDGIGVYYKPPVYPITINSLDFFIQNGLGDGYTAVIYADNGPLGAPGTILSTNTVAAGSVVSAAWNNVSLSTPVTIDSAGFYVVWLQAGPNIFMGLETAFPISRNTYEILDGAWSIYRENENQDASIRVNISSAGLDNTVNTTLGILTASQAGATYQWLDCNNSYAVIPGQTAQSFTPSANGSYAVSILYGGCIDTSACITINNVGLDENTLFHTNAYPNPAGSFIFINLQTPVMPNNPVIQVVDMMGKMVEVDAQINTDVIRLNVEQLSKGVYTYTLVNNGQIFAIGKFIKQ
jgi:hypothetical protein